MTRGQSSTFFDKLRRDKSLFVLLASFILLLQAMQPLALANQASSGGHFVICTDGDVDPGQPQQHVDCSKCLASGCRIMAVAVPGPVGSGTAVITALVAVAIDWPAAAQTTDLPSSPTHLPPARAPPVTV